MTPFDYDFLQDFIQSRSGLVLSADKHYLVESRLSPIAKAAGLENIPGLVSELKRGAPPKIVDAIVEAMTSNESYFFRDRTPFQWLQRDMLPTMIAARPDKKMRIWSAAAAHGQEPYSLAMSLLEQRQQLAGWQVDLLASDISSAAIEKAQAGVYSQFEVQRGMPIELLIKYFDQREDAWQVKSEVRSMVQFSHHNLIDDFSGQDKLDVIFCRNVLGSFGEAHKNAVVAQLHACLADDGYLMLGAAETLEDISTSFHASSSVPGLYCCSEAAAADGSPAAQAAVG